jgi:hypothetical protein
MHILKIMLLLTGTAVSGAGVVALFRALRFLKSAPQS